MPDSISISVRDSGYSSSPLSSPNSPLGRKATTPKLVLSPASPSSHSPQHSQQNIRKRFGSPRTLISPKTRPSSMVLEIESLNELNISNGNKQESNHPMTSGSKTEVSNQLASSNYSNPTDSDAAASDTLLSPMVVGLKRAVPDETIKTLRPLSRELEDVILPKQCIAIQQLVKKGRHLDALTQAIQFSCDFAFEKDCQDIFKARAYVYFIGEEKEAPGIELWFEKQLDLEIKKYIARQMLRGVLIRYPMRSFPRTFWIGEGDAVGFEKPSALLINDAVGTHYYVYELGRKIHDILVKQWWDDTAHDLKVARVAEGSDGSGTHSIEMDS